MYVLAQVESLFYMYTHRLSGHSPLPLGFFAPALPPYHLRRHDF